MRTFRKEHNIILSQLPPDLVHHSADLNVKLFKVHSPACPSSHSRPPSIHCNCLRYIALHCCYTFGAFCAVIVDQQTLHTVPLASQQRLPISSSVRNTDQSTQNNPPEQQPPVNLRRPPPIQLSKQQQQQ